MVYDKHKKIKTYGYYGKSYFEESSIDINWMIKKFDLLGKMKIAKNNDKHELSSK